MAVFQKQQKVRFADTDYAGIIFYPRYFEMVNALIEDWFAESLGASFQSLIKGGHGAPLVNIETQFLSPCTLGDVLSFELSVSRLGDKSVTLDVSARCGAEMKIGSKMTLVHAKRDMTGADPWPDAIRAKMKTYLKENNDGA